jgi:sulfite reductase (NADPH) flavoprotein alpha-component
LRTPSSGGTSVAALAERIAAFYPGVEQIRRAPSGRITAYYFDEGRPGAAVIDPATGKGVGTADTPALERWVTNLHRSLFLGDAGRIVAAGGAAAMLVLSLSGVALVTRRTGGWRRVLSPLKGPLSGRLHVEIARIAVVGLLLSSATALWMSASTFDLGPEGPGAPPFPRQVSGRTGFAPADMPLLRDTPVAELRELTFPYPGDATDVFTLKTDAGEGYVDQGTGALLAWSDLGAWDRATETIYMLHTGKGAPVLGPGSCSACWRLACRPWREPAWSSGPRDGAAGHVSRATPLRARPTPSSSSAAREAAPGASPRPSTPASQLWDSVCTSRPCRPSRPAAMRAPRR